jgi:hypothetical protein
MHFRLERQVELDLQTINPISALCSVMQRPAVPIELVADPSSR